MGYRSCGHASAAESLESGQAESAAVILTDIQMPGMDGFDLKRMLDARGCTTPVIMMTGRADGHLETRAREVGAFCFMRKPLDAKILAECLDRALSDR
jgi:FixJ family two-component response regulator